MITGKLDPENLNYTQIKPKSNDPQGFTQKVMPLFSVKNPCESVKICDQMLYYSEVSVVGGS